MSGEVQEIYRVSGIRNIFKMGKGNDSTEPANQKLEKIGDRGTVEEKQDAIVT